MIAAIEKPAYLPGVEYFDLLYKADVLVLYDTMTVSRRDAVCRTKIYGENGPEWLTIPIRRSGRRGQTLQAAQIELAHNWRRKHLKKLYHYYRLAPYFEDIYPNIREIIQRSGEGIVDLNEALTERVAEMLQLSCRIVRASALNVKGEKTAYLVKLLHTVGALTYVASDRYRGYLNPADFERAGISLRFSGFRHPVYPQPDRECIHDLSVFDTLCHCGRRGVYGFLTPLNG